MEKVFRHKLMVRYAETDQMGIVYYANYLVWFEAARTDFLKSIGIPYRELEKSGIFLPVAEAFCKYLSPAYYEDEITVETYLSKIGNASIEISYKVKREDKVIATGYTKHACTNKEGKIQRIPENIKEKLKKYLVENA